MSSSAMPPMSTQAAVEVAAPAAATTRTLITTLQYTLWLDVDKSKFFHSNYALLEGEIMRVRTDIVTLPYPYRRRDCDDGGRRQEQLITEAEEGEEGQQSVMTTLDLQRGQRVYVIIKHNVQDMYRSFVPSSLEEERRKAGISTDTPWATGWLRHEMYGLLTKVQLQPLRLPAASSQSLVEDDSTNGISQYPLIPPVASIRNKNGTKSLDFESKFLGLVNPDDVDDNPRLNTKDGDEGKSDSDMNGIELNYTADQDDVLTINQCDLNQRKTRHRHFAKWLVHKFGSELLNSGTGVLDVAGGNGKVSMELSKLGIRSTIVDPKPILLTSKQRSAEIPNGCTSNATHRIRIIPEPLIGDGRQLTRGFSANDDNEEENVRKHNNAASSISNSDDFFVPPSEYAHIVSNCSVIVGLHPDAATEPIVQTALRLQKPFAVAPCCVVSKLFPGRRRKTTGEMVRTTWDLCRYILDLSPTEKVASTTVSEKKSSGDNNDRHVQMPTPTTSKLPSSGFEVELLPFAGRNKVIYWLANSPPYSPVGSVYCQEVASTSSTSSTTKRSSQSDDEGDEKRRRID